MTSLSKLICGSHTQLAVSWWRGYHQDRLCDLYGPPWSSDYSCKAPEFACSSPHTSHLSSHSSQLLTPALPQRLCWKQQERQKFGSCQSPSLTRTLMRTLKAAITWLWVLHPGGTMAFQFGEILSGSLLVAFQAHRIASPAACLKKIQNRFLKEAERV